MAKFYGVTPIPGVKDLYSLLDFLADKKTYEAQINALIDTREEILALIGKVGKADQIETLLAQAKEKQALAVQAVDQAKLTASALLAEAQDKADALAAQSELESAHLQEQAQEMAQAQDSFDAYKVSQEQLLASWQQKLEEREALASKMRQESLDIMAEYQAKLDKLKTIL